MTDKKVAILVSTYNGENYIEEQLNSLLKQTYKNIHILCRKYLCFTLSYNNIW